MDLNALKCIQIHILQKGQTKYQQIVKNGKKLPKIANNCKISEITKYGEKMTTLYKNVKKCKKNAKNEPKTVLKLPQKIDTVS